MLTFASCMDNAERLGVERISTLLLRLSLPSVLGMLAITIYNVADTIFVGQAVGVGAIAGLSVTLPLMLMINNTFGQAVGLGGASIISRALGARNRELAELVLHNLVFMILCLNVLLFGLVIAFLPDLLRLFGADDSILPYSMEYAVWCLPGSFAMNIFFVFINVIRAEGNTKFAMWCQVLTAVINLVLDPIFIFIFGWGVKGAAIATSISQIVSAALGLWYFRRSKKRVLSLSYRECFKLPKPKVLGETLALGSASFGRQLAHSSTSIVLNNVLGGVGGSIAIAAYGIINRLTMFVFMPIFGVNQGFMPIAGYNYGAEKYGRVIGALKAGIIFSTVICIVGFVLFELIPHQLLFMFSDDEELVEIGARGLRIFVLAIPVVGCQVIGSGLFQALGKAKPAFFLSIARQLIFLIPLVILLPRYCTAFWGDDAIWYAFPISDLLSTVITILMSHGLVKSLIDKKKVA